MNSIFYGSMPSPLGPLMLSATSAGLCGVFFETQACFRRPPPHWTQSAAHVDFARKQLDQYFAGERSRFDLPFVLSGTTFQMRVWQELLAIPFGQTASYAEVARRLRTPGAARAVGTANARNPLPVIVPCHRIIGTDGSLTGYAGGESRKRWLLQLEGCARVTRRNHIARNWASSFGGGS